MKDTSIGAHLPPIACNACRNLALVADNKNQSAVFCYFVSVGNTGGHECYVSLVTTLEYNAESLSVQKRMCKNWNPVVPESIVCPDRGPMWYNRIPRMLQVTLLSFIDQGRKGCW